LCFFLKSMFIYDITLKTKFQMTTLLKFLQKYTLVGLCSFFFCK
jgi:hypothetical protein